jgi:hypothetical protein
MLNREQQLELILDYISNDLSRYSGFAGEALVYYVMSEYPDLSTDVEIAQKCSELVANYNISALHSKDLIDIEIDEDGEEILTLTEKGKEIDLLH